MHKPSNGIHHCQNRLRNQSMPSVCRFSPITSISRCGRFRIPVQLLLVRLRQAAAEAATYSNSCCRPLAIVVLVQAFANLFEAFRSRDKVPPLLHSVALYIVQTVAWSIYLLNIPHDAESYYRIVS